LIGCNDVIGDIPPGVGGSQAYIAQIETDPNERDADAYRAIASALEVNIDDWV